MGMDIERENHYIVLGVPIDATPDEIRTAYRELARQLHPDASQEPETADQFIQVQAAYEVLSDPKRRREYDDQLPPIFKRPPVKISLEYSRTSILPISEPQLVYVLLRIDPQDDIALTVDPPLNLCMVIDCSTSMQGTVMDSVKSTAIEVVRQLREQDIISVVSFSDRAEVIVPAGHNQDRRQVITNIRMLQTSGGTEIFKGLEAGFMEVKRYRSPRNINHILLITDGRTYGDEAACEELAIQASNLKIGISALGIGSKWNDNFMDRLANRTGGSTMYVNRSVEVARFIKEKVSGLGRCYSDQVFYNFDKGLGVELRYAFRLQPEVSVLDTQSPLALGSILRDTSTEILFEYYLAPIEDLTSASVTLTRGRINMEIPSRATPHYSIRADLACSITAETDETPPPQSIVHAMSRLTLYRIQERARKEVAEGNVKEATRHLQYVATHLLAQGQKELARTVLGEAIHLQQDSSFSEDGEKRIKYGTRALLLPPSVEKRSL